MEAEAKALGRSDRSDTNYARFVGSGLLNRTPGPRPFDSMNSIPAFFSTASIAEIEFESPAYRPTSLMVIVYRWRPDRPASSRARAPPAPLRLCRSRPASSPPSRAPCLSGRSFAGLQRADDRSHHCRIRATPDPNTHTVDTLATFSFAKFCIDYPSECQSSGGSAQIELTAERLAMLASALLIGLEIVFFINWAAVVLIDGPMWD